MLTAPVAFSAAQSNGQKIHLFYAGYPTKTEDKNIFNTRKILIYIILGK